MYNVTCLFPAAEYQFEKISDAVGNPMLKKHKVAYTIKNGELVVLKSTNPYYTKLIEAEHSIKMLDKTIDAARKLKLKHTKELGSALETFFESSEFIHNKYNRGEIAVKVSYYSGKGYYKVRCRDKILRKTTKLIVNELAEINLIILKLLFEIPVELNKYVIIDGNDHKHNPNDLDSPVI